MRTKELIRGELWSIPVWMTFGIINGTQVVVGMRAQGMQHPWARLFAVFALSWSLWAIISPFVMLLGKECPVRRYWARHLAFYLAIGIVDAAWTVFLDTFFQPMGMPAPSGVTNWIAVFYSRFHFDLLAYAGVLALGQMLESRKTLAERDEQLSKARLDSLKRQLQPHFLFNTLNGIAGLVRTGNNNTAVEMIAGLSDLLRRVVDGRTENESSLHEEMGFLEKYLGIQKMRFADRLHFELCLPSELADMRVPSMILQPLVENALEHGIAMRLEGGHVSVCARRSSGLLSLTVTNDGPAVRSLSEGVGIANTRARLKSMYGDAAGFELKNNAAGWVEAVVTVPIHG